MSNVQRTLLAVLLLAAAGCSDDATKPDPESKGFWAEVELDHRDWAERFPSLRELANAADVAAVATLRSADDGVVLQGDAEEDIYTEIVVHAEIESRLRGEGGADELAFTLVLPRAFSRKSQAQSVARANAALPIDDVVVLLRQRKDMPYYRVINGYGLWAHTPRAELDAPLNIEAPSDDDIYADELADITSITELRRYLRESVSD